jgi:hypothetical protein
MYIYDHVWRAIPSCWSRSLVAMLTVAVQEVRFSTADYQLAHSGVKKRSRAFAAACKCWPWWLVEAELTWRWPRAVCCVYLHSNAHSHGSSP